MPSSTNLIIALVFAALFGAGLVSLALYFVHSYIRDRCRELDHWFQRLIPKQLRSPCRHCEGTGRDLQERSRSRSSQRKSRSQSRAKRGKSRHGKRMHETDTEWNAIDAKEGQLRGGGQSLPRPKAALPAVPTVQSPGVTEHYNPWQVPSPQQYAQPVMSPQTFPQMPQPPLMPQPPSQGGAQLGSYAMPAPLPSYQAQPVLSSASSMPPYHKPPRKSRSERPVASSRSRSRQTPKDASRVRTTDFIHIVDDYPPIVKEAIRKAAKNQEPVLSSALSSTDSSTSTESVEEVPRMSIPQATPRFVNPAPFPLPQYPLPANRAWTAPTVYPQQWNRDGEPVEQARYASPYTRPGVWIPSPKEMRRPRHAPGNATPQTQGTSPESLRVRPADRLESVTRTLRRSRRANGSPRCRVIHEKYVRSERGEGVDAQKRAEVPDHPRSGSSSPNAGSCKTKPAEHRASSHNGIPLMSPMPIPIVEEPLSECGSAMVGKPVTVSSMSDATTHARPTASTVRSPSVGI